LVSFFDVSSLQPISATLPTIIEPDSNRAKVFRMAIYLSLKETRFNPATRAAEVPRL
jgi:hypothetical protein